MIIYSENGLILADAIQDTVLPELNVEVSHWSIRNWSQKARFSPL
jgi:hypothetical protein